MSAVLGIDGGGTHTRASIVDGDRVLAFAESGSIKRLRVGAVAADENMRAILKDVYAQAGVASAAAASCGVASATMPGIAEWITAVFRDARAADQVLGLQRVTGRAVAAGYLTQESAGQWLDHLATQPFFASTTLFIITATAG